VVELDGGDGACGADRCGEAGEAGEMGVGPDAELAGEGLAALLDMGRAGHGEGKAAPGAHGEPAEFVVGERAVGVALLVGEGGEQQPVRERRTPPEREGIGELWHRQGRIRRNWVWRPSI
jgi:hypothetical protein